MDGTIRLTGLRVFAHHGVLPEEQVDGQEFVIDVTVDMDLKRAVESDELAFTVDYGALADRIRRRVSEERWNLIERVAGRVVDLVLEDERVEAVEVTVHKPNAPIGAEFDDVSVSIRRTR
ncbi:MAG: dihydroneopterin aldolase [Acidimicrobiia bacterium]